MGDESAPVIVGIIPAAGRAMRIAPLPCSKELLPIGFHKTTTLRGRPKVVSEYLLEGMRRAGARRVYFVIRPGKFDIPEYFGNGSRLGLNLAYLMMGDPYGPPFTVAQAIPFVGEATVVFGFPDILITPGDAITRLIARLGESGADVVLGLFRAAPHDSIDIVTRNPNGRIHSLATKEEQPARAATDVGYMLAAWRQTFTAFLEKEIPLARRIAAHQRREWPMGTMFAAAIRDGLHVDSVLFDDGRFLDVGTPGGLAAAVASAGVWQGTESPR